MFDTLLRGDLPSILDSTVSFYFPHCSCVLSTVTGLRWRFGFEPTCVETDEEPPLRVSPDSETIPIDEYLGRYDASRREIVLFRRAISVAAERLACNPIHLRQIVLFHEYAHAILHLGFDDTGEQCDTTVYLNIEEIVHESIAQLLTARALELRVGDTADERAKANWHHVRSVVFPDLEQRQSALYQQWHQFESMSPLRLRRLLQAVRRPTSVDRWDGFSLFGD
jgi:hypothetical protein